MEKYLSEQGLEELRKKLNYLREVERKEVAERLKKAAALGDLTENSEYQEAKESQAFLEGKILELENLIRNAAVAPAEKINGFIRIGSVVFVNDGQKKEKFKLVGAAEASPAEGKISIDSPLGRALINQPQGAVIAVNTPRGEVKYKILKINF